MTAACIHDRAYRCLRCQTRWCLLCDRHAWVLEDLAIAADGRVAIHSPVQRPCTLCGVEVYQYPRALTIPLASLDFLALRLAPSIRRIERRLLDGPYAGDSVLLDSLASRHDRRRWLKRLRPLLEIASDAVAEGEPEQAETILQEMLHPLLAQRIARRIQMHRDRLTGWTIARESGLYVSLHSAEPTESQSEHEIAYTRYARVPLANSEIRFPQGEGGAGTATHFGVGQAEEGMGRLLFSGTISPVIVTGALIQPQLRVETADARTRPPGLADDRVDAAPYAYDAPLDDPEDA